MELPYHAVVDNLVTFGDQLSSRVYCLHTLHTPSSPLSILSEAVLLDEYGIQVLKDPPRLQHADGSTTPAIRQDGQFFVNMQIHPHRPDSIPDHRKAIAAAANTGDTAMLWAARFQTDASGRGECR